MTLHERKYKCNMTIFIIVCCDLCDCLFPHLAALSQSSRNELITKADYFFVACLLYLQ